MKKHVRWYLPAALAAVCLSPPPAIARVYAPAVREMTERRTMTSKTFLLADGTYTAEISCEPIHYKADDGSWLPINTDLTRATKAGFAFTNDTNPLKTSLPASNGGWVRAEYEGAAIEFHPLGGQDTPLVASTCGVTSGAVWHDTSIAYTVLPGQLKEDIILSSASAPASFAFAIRTEGLTPKVQPGGRVDFQAADGSNCLSIPPPWMIDASGERCTEIAVTCVRSDDGYVYTLTPKATWLQSADYPVKIDPSVSFYADWVGVVNGVLPFMDTQYLGGIWNTTCPYWSGYACWVGSQIDQYDNYSVKGWRSVLHFVGASIPIDGDVNWATLNILVFDGDRPGASVPVKAYELGKALNPPSVTWNNVGGDVPSGLSSPEINLQIPANPCNVNYQNFSFTVTNIVQNWIQRGGYYGDDNEITTSGPTFLLRSALEEGTIYDARHVRFKQPALTINYNGGWYTFQGNARRTGRAYTAIGSNPTPHTPYRFTLPTGDQPFEQDIHPGVLAVSQSTSSMTTWPYVYTAVVSTQNTAFQTIVSEFSENSNGFTLQSTRTLSDFIATGTPMVVSGKLIVVGNTTTGVGQVHALNATNLGNAIYWTVNMPGPILDSPAYSPLATSYVKNGDTTACSTGTVIIACNVTSSPPSFNYPTALDPPDNVRQETTAGILYALSLSDGKHVWGNVDASGEPVADTAYDNGTLTGSSPGGLIPFWGQATHSSPSLSLLEGLAYVADDYHAINVRDLSTGNASGYGGNGVPSMAPPGEEHHYKIEGGPTLFGSRLLYTTAPTDTDHESGWEQSVIVSDGQPSTMPEWFYPLKPPCTDYSLYGWPIGEEPCPALPPTWITPPVYAENRSTFFANDVGLLAGIGTDLDPSSLDFLPQVRWIGESGDITGEPIATVPVHCSPLVAGALGSADACVYFGTDAGYVYVFRAPVQTTMNAQYVRALGDSGNPDGHLSGKVRSSMACYRGRLYVLSAGVNGNQSLSQNQPTLYSFGPTP